MMQYDVITVKGQAFALVPIEELAQQEAQSKEEREDIIVASLISTQIDEGEETYPIELGESLSKAYQTDESLIRVWRNYRGLTQAELAAQADISRDYLAAIETGRKTGSVDTLKALATALGVGLDDIV